MLSLYYGKNNQIKFKNEAQIFEALGYLCRNSGATSLHYEKNSLQGAYGDEGRIHFYIDNPKIPGCFTFTIGTGNIKSRVNCNDFFYFLKNLGFKEGKDQDVEQIRNNITSNPQFNKYLNDFNSGIKIID
ncbi:hypothetical protein RBO56_000684 [Campylobacter lari]|nr:hypothetical protein [Campylobacter lari]HEC1756366.1 hypothetical protein [Campylobacter lari]